MCNLAAAREFLREARGIALPVLRLVGKCARCVTMRSVKQCVFFFSAFEIEREVWAAYTPPHFFPCHCRLAFLQKISVLSMGMTDMRKHIAFA